jgi:hypothetical protein
MRGHGLKRSEHKSTIPKYFDDNTKFPSPEAFTVNFIYSKKSRSHPAIGESVVVIAESYDKAMEEAFDMRAQKTRTPIEVELVDPNIGSAISWLGGKIKSAAGVGARFAVKAGRVGAGTAVNLGRKAGESVKNPESGFRQFVAKRAEEGHKAISSKVYEAKVRYLIKDAYSPDPVKRNSARASLRQHYPDIYDSMDFSRGQTPQQRVITHVHGTPEEVRYANLSPTQRSAERRKEPDHELFIPGTNKFVSKHGVLEQDDSRLIESIKEAHK